jgi:c-di-GMP-binding flagellar brake protein YcgR
MDEAVSKYSNKLRPGVRGEIVINAGLYKGRYASRVQEMIKDNVVGLDHPLLQGALLPAYRYLDFTFVFEDNGALYMFDMSVMRVDTKADVPVLWAEIFGEPRRVQRRQFLRVPCFWDVSMFHVEREVRLPMTVTWVYGKAVDISLGGIRFKVTNDAAGGQCYESGDRMFISFDIAGKRNFQFGRASRIVHEHGAWAIGVGFDSLPTSVERKLFEFIRQQELMGREQK